MPTAKEIGKKNKEMMLRALHDNLMNISEACKVVGINRQTYYNYISTDKEFAKAVDDVKEATIDFVESALMKAVKRGNMAAIIFYLKTQGKHRGYYEKVVTEHSTEVVKVTVKKDTVKKIRKLAS